MNPIILRLLILIVIFATVFLLSEFAIGFFRRHRKGATAINKRLRMIEGGMDREIVTSHLRKSQPTNFANLPEFIGAPLRRIQRSVIASGVALPAHQIMLAMALASAVVSVFILIVAALSGYTISLGVVQLAVIVGLCIGGAVPMIILSRMASKRKRKMQEQFPVALDVFIRGLRAGHP